MGEAVQHLLLLSYVRLARNDTSDLMRDVLHYNAARVSERVRTGGLVFMMLLGFVVAWQEKAEQRLNFETSQ